MDPMATWPRLPWLNAASHCSLRRWRCEATENSYLWCIRELKWRFHRFMVNKKTMFIFMYHSWIVDDLDESGRWFRFRWLPDVFYPMFNLFLGQSSSAYDPTSHWTDRDRNRIAGHLEIEWNLCRISWTNKAICLLSEKPMAKTPKKNSQNPDFTIQLAQSFQENHPRHSWPSNAFKVHCLMSIACPLANDRWLEISLYFTSGIKTLVRFRYTMVISVSLYKVSVNSIWGFESCPFIQSMARLKTFKASKQIDISLQANPYRNESLISVAHRVNEWFVCTFYSAPGASRRWLTQKVLLKTR